jgi:YesN/AraC family two-component response regulator
MKGDREKAISAGASDYVSKPVNPDRLLSLLHGWIEKFKSSKAQAGPGRGLSKIVEKPSDSSNRSQKGKERA